MKAVLTTLLILMHQLCFATTFHIEISNDINAPTPDFLVQEALLSPPPPVFTLQSFNTFTPTNVNFLIKIRAIGNLRTIMDNNPNWERAQLQQYLTVIYPDGYKGRKPEGQNYQFTSCIWTYGNNYPDI